MQRGREAGQVYQGPRAMDATLSKEDTDLKRPSAQWPGGWKPWTMNHGPRQ